VAAEAEVVAGEVAGEGTDAPRGSLPTNGTLWASAQRRWTERRSRASRGPAGRSLGSFRWRALDACLAYRVLSFRPALGLRASVLPCGAARAMAVQVPEPSIPTLSLVIEILAEIVLALALAGRRARCKTTASTAHRCKARRFSREQRRMFRR